MLCCVACLASSIVSCDPFGRFCAVPDVHVPARVSVPPQGPGGAPQHGHYGGGLPLLDVARTGLHHPLPAHWLHVGAVQRLHPIPALLH